LLIGRNFLASHLITETNIVSIPLINFSAPIPRWPLEKNDPEWNSFPTICVKGHELPEGCYGVEIEDESMTPVLKTSMTAVFSQNVRAPALKSIYSIGLKGEDPVVRKVVKNEIPATEKNDVPQKTLRSKRKSFMTPTPLHIPGSLVSPIPESTHETIFLKSLANPETLTLVPSKNLLWMHPLVLVLNKEEVRCV
jgi:hypothetical protein